MLLYSTKQLCATPQTCHGSQPDISFLWAAGQNVLMDLISGSFRILQLFLSFVFVSKRYRARHSKIPGQGAQTYLQIWLAVHFPLATQHITARVAPSQQELLNTK